MIEPIEADRLLQAAKEARANAYAPYSGFAVGAALLAGDGKVYRGANVENASYGLSMCAERTALGSAATEGVRTFRAVAIAGPEGHGPCPPCGACRQVLREFGSELTVVVEGAEGASRQLVLNELLPEAFGPSLLRGQAAGEGQ